MQVIVILWTWVLMTAVTVVTEVTETLWHYPSFRGGSWCPNTTTGQNRPLGAGQLGQFRWNSSRSKGLEYSPPGTRAGRPVTVSPKCHGPNRLRPLLRTLGVKVRPVRCVRGGRGEGFQEWDMEVGWILYLDESCSRYVTLLTCLCIGKGPM